MRLFDFTLTQLNARPCLVVSIAVLSWAASANAQVADPRIGYWVEQRGRSPEDPAPVGLHLSFEDLGGGALRYKLGANHTPEYLESVEAKCDGARYPFVYGTGKPVGRMYSCRIVGPRSVETISTQGEASAARTSTLIETVSEDGTTMTGVFTVRDAAGQVVDEGRRRFFRRAPDPRIGYWIEQKASPADPRPVGLHVSYEALEGGLIRLTFGPNYQPANLLRVDAQCDGREYAFVNGTGTPNGHTLSCRVAGPRSVEYVYTQEGAQPWVTSAGVETVSDDGDTLTWVATHRDADGRFVEELRRQFSRRR